MYSTSRGSMAMVKVVSGLAFALACAVSYAKVPPEQVARLGVDLTPLGAEKAGNADGSIPTWEGGVSKPIAGYTLGDHHPDPFPDDQVVLTIDASNVDLHKSRLSAGQLAMLQKYKSFKLPVYPTRRSAAFPERIYEMTRRNAATGELVDGGAGVIGVAEGIPFPIPANGMEVMWNHKLKYKGVAVERFSNQVVPTASGQFTPIRVREQILGLYWKEGSTLADTNGILSYFYQAIEAPARLAGGVLLVHESLNQQAQPRQAWVYNPGQRRVRKAPNVAYDNTGSASDGLRTNDMTDMFNGALDRFDWELVGKREMYIPYNNYKIHAGGLKYEDIVRPGHINQDLMRYELHRVWVVDAVRKPGMRHINSRRTFYLDEDSWQIVLTDHYDDAGAIWRSSEAATVSYYEVPLYWSTLEVHYDLKAGRYIASGLDNNDKEVNFAFQTKPEDFSPQALRTRGTR
jgi:hypothetical protein